MFIHLLHIFCANTQLHTKGILCCSPHFFKHNYLHFSLHQLLFVYFNVFAKNGFENGVHPRISHYSGFGLNQVSVITAKVGNNKNFGKNSSMKLEDLIFTNVGMTYTSASISCSRRKNETVIWYSHLKFYFNSRFKLNSDLFCGQKYIT